MSRKKVLVLGGRFGGLTAAISVTHQLHGDVDVRVVSSSEDFLFTPTLIWVQAHAMKLGFEKYFLWKMKHGQVRLP